ncbi:MAG: hypothetical protein KJO28_01815 [Desulfofustis sp.]|nr:hypothetical protein [Desulfofustis sp.]
MIFDIVISVGTPQSMSCLQLAMVLKEESIKRSGHPGGYREWLVKAADQGHLKAAQELVLHPHNRQRLVYVNRALEIEREKVRRYESASPLERQIIEIEERYRLQYQDAVNALPRGDGTREGKLQFQKEVNKLLEKYNQLRDAEIEKIRSYQ